MNIVDSSGWLEYFAGTRNGAIFGKPIQNLHELLVPTITLAEVFKKVLLERDEESAFQAVAYMRRGRIVDMDASIAVEAAKFGFQFKLPLADSIIYATAKQYHAVLWTQDEDFKGLESVKYVPK